MWVMSLLPECEAAVVPLTWRLTAHVSTWAALSAGSLNEQPPVLFDGLVLAVTVICSASTWIVNGTAGIGTTSGLLMPSLVMSNWRSQTTNDVAVLFTLLLSVPRCSVARSSVAFLSSSNSVWVRPSVGLPKTSTPATIDSVDRAVNQRRPFRLGTTMRLITIGPSMTRRLFRCGASSWLPPHQPRCPRLDLSGFSHLPSRHRGEGRTGLRRFGAPEAVTPGVTKGR